MDLAKAKRWAPAVGVAVLAVGGAGVLALNASKTAACRFPPEVARGRQAADTCKSCHDIAASPPLLSNPNPNLQFVYASPIGTQPIAGGRKNRALLAARDAGLTWTDENLVEYLKGPKAFLVRATGKTFADIDYMPYSIDAEPRRRDVVAYLKFIKTRRQCD